MFKQANVDYIVQTGLKAAKKYRGMKSGDTFLDKTTVNRWATGKGRAKPYSVYKICTAFGLRMHFSEEGTCGPELVSPFYRPKPNSLLTSDEFMEQLLEIGYACIMHGLFGTKGRPTGISFSSNYKMGWLCRPESNDTGRLLVPRSDTSIAYICTTFPKVLLTIDSSGINSSGWENYEVVYVPEDNDDLRDAVMRRCLGCNKLKPLSDFHYKSREKTFGPKCRACRDLENNNRPLDFFEQKNKYNKQYARKGKVEHITRAMEKKATPVGKYGFFSALSLAEPVQPKS